MTHLYQKWYIFVANLIKLNILNIKYFNNMVKVSLAFTFVLLFSGLYGQKVSPVSWKFDIRVINKSEVEITATADITKGWVTYSQFTDPDGPIPTEFVIGDVKINFEEKSKAVKEMDEMFGVEVIKFKDKAIFVKTMPMPATGKVDGYVSYMTCDGARCLPPVDVNFSLSAK